MNVLEEEIFVKGMPRFRYRNKTVLFEDAKQDTRYWWWAFLRLSPDYWYTCVKSGMVEDKRLRNMYLDFGNVFESNFEDWWRKYGISLFAEEIAPPSVRVIDKRRPIFSKGNIQYMVVEIPLNLTAQTIKKQVMNVVYAAEGREVKRYSTAPRSLSKLKGIRKDIFPVAHQIAEKVYQSIAASGKTNFSIGEVKGNKSLYQIGKEMQLVKACMPAIGDKPERSKQKVNGMKVAVSRMLHRAQLLTQNAAIGNFPCVQKLEEPIHWSNRNQNSINLAVLEQRFKPLFHDDDILQLNQ
jgi:hypothetical protein